MSFQIPKNSYSGKINALKLGTGDSQVLVGGETALPFYTFEGENPKETPEVVEIARKIKNPNRKVVIMSDQARERGPFLKNRFDFMKDFDKIFFSYEIGFVKSERESFEEVLNDCGVKAEEAFFIDDKQKFIDVAASLGIKTHLYKNPEELEKALKNASININSK